MSSYLKLQWCPWLSDFVLWSWWWSVVQQSVGNIERTSNPPDPHCPDKKNKTYLLKSDILPFLPYWLLSLIPLFIHRCVCVFAVLLKNMQNMVCRVHRVHYRRCSILHQNNTNVSSTKNSNSNVITCSRNNSAENVRWAFLTPIHLNFTMMAYLQSAENEGLNDELTATIMWFNHMWSLSSLQ